MSQINPFTHVVFQSIELQRQASVEKVRQVRRAQTQEKDIAAQDDVLEHQVESIEEDHATLDEKDQPKRQAKREKHDDESDGDKPHIDLTA